MRTTYSGSLLELYPQLEVHEEMRITSATRLRMMLELLVPELPTWGTAPGTYTAETFIDQAYRRAITKREATMFMVPIRGEDKIIRRIRTITILIGCSHPELGTVYLYERKLKNGVLQQRKHQNSMSETLWLNETDPRLAVRRAMLEELNVRVPLACLQKPYLNPITSTFKALSVLEAGYDFMASHHAMPPEVFPHFSDKFPGTITWNTLDHFYFNMPLKYFNESGYLDGVTGNRFNWSITHPWSGAPATFTT